VIRKCALVVAVVVLASSCYKAAYDFNGDNKADRIWVDSAGTWFRAGDAEPYFVGQRDSAWVPGDYDGDGIWEAAFTGGGDWVTSAGAGTINFPRPAGENDGFRRNIYPVPADYDGDHRTDPAWYRDVDGMWFVKGKDPVQFGSGPTKVVADYNTQSDAMDQDMPVPADYDGDGKADLATYRFRTGEWKVLSSKTGAVSTATLGGSSSGLHFPAPADYDGNGTADRAVFSAATGWQIEGVPGANTFGANGTDAYPAQADYVGDGKAELSVFDTHGGLWSVQGAPTIDLQWAETTSNGPWPAEVRSSLVMTISRATILYRCALVEGTIQACP
jgi:hypothetical protein